VDIALGDPGVLGSLISIVALAVIVSWFGFGLGLLIRNSPATVTIFLLWPLLIENLIGLVLSLIGGDGATKWLPYSAGISATVADDESGVDPDILGRPNGLLYFGGVALVLVALGAWSDGRRDA
jgi:ABC-2 type transport system permease protein